MGLTYKDAGVDIDAADAFVERIKPAVARATRPEVMGGIGGFGGLFALKDYTDPVLVSGTDGVGTKLKIAFDTDRHQTVGIDLVAMCVNDIIVCGAEPLFFLDYFATGALSVDQGAAVVEGIAEGCAQSGCALLGGETAEMPGFYPPGEYDLAGFCVGVVERAALRDGSTCVAGDVLVGLASSGLHSNGYSLARRLVTETGASWDDRPEALGGETLADALLAPTRIYARALAALAAEVDLKAAAHITGGGIPGNLPRSLPGGIDATLDVRRWPRPKVFDWITATGEVELAEQFRAFNMGLGMIVVVQAADAERAVSVLEANGEAAWVVGELTAGAGPGSNVTLEGTDS